MQRMLHGVLNQDLVRVTDEIDEYQRWKPAGVDLATGRMYYFDTKTLETAWHRPSEKPSGAESSDEPPPPSLLDSSRDQEPGPSGGPARGRSLTVTAAVQRKGGESRYDELPPYFYITLEDAVPLIQELSEEGTRECSDLRQASMRGGWVHRGVCAGPTSQKVSPHPILLW